MGNTILTPTKVTRKALMILHQKLAFIGTIERQYDSQFAVDGAKIGATLTIRMPNRYVTGTGTDITPQDTVEGSQVLTVATQRHVPMAFLSSELTLSMDDFAERVLDPAMSVLASVTENDAFNMFKDIYQQVGTPGSAPNALLTFLQAGAVMDNSLAPRSSRNIQLPPLDSATIIDALKGLFNDSTAISKQYRDGMMGRTAGFDWYSNTLTGRVTAGNKVTGVTVGGASQVGSTIVFGSTSNLDTFKKGQVFTMEGCYEIHPETKVVSTRLQKFTVTADTTATTTTVSVPISPAIVAAATGYQNVSASPTNGGAVVFDAAANLNYGLIGTYYKQAFAIVFADLIMPKGTDFAAREVLDGISMRIIRDYAVLSDKLITRIDILYGYKTLRPEFACRIATV